MKLLLKSLICCLVWATGSAQKPSPAKVVPIEVSPQLQDKLNLINATIKKNNYSFTVRATSVAGLPLSEITGLVLPDDPKKLSLPTPLRRRGATSYPQCVSVPFTAASPEVDMRTLGIITPPKQQGRCLSCFVFAAVAALETNILLKNGGNANSLDLSEAQVLTCMGRILGLNNNCGSGGIHGDAANFMKDNRILLEPEWPYEFKFSDRCPQFQNSSSPFQAIEWNYVSGSALNSSPSVQAIKEAIIRYGSVAVTMRATETFEAYGGGIYDANDNISIVPDHVVQLVGWSDRDQCWIMKNSWGTNWGEGGFCKIKYNTNAVGGYAIWMEAQDVDGSGCPRFAIAVPVAPEIRPFNRLFKFGDAQGNYVLEVSDPIGIEGVSGKGTVVQQWESHGPLAGASDGHNQEWILIPRGERGGNKLFQILNNGFLKFLTAKNNGSITVEFGADNDSQLWEMVSEGDAYLLKSVATNQFLQKQNGAWENGIQMVQVTVPDYNLALFKLSSLPVPEFDNGVINRRIFIKPFHAGNMVLDLTAGNTANGTPFQLWQKMANNGNQLFILKKEADAYSIEHALGGGSKVIENINFSPANGNRQVLWDRTGGLNQKWWIIPCVRDRGRLIFINLQTGKSLDAAAAGTTNGTPVNQWMFQRNANQKWEILMN